MLKLLYTFQNVCKNPTHYKTTSDLCLFDIIICTLFQMSYQFTVWDRFKEIGNFSDHQRSHLGKLLTHLFASKALSLSVLKVGNYWIGLHVYKLCSVITSLDKLCIISLPTQEILFPNITETYDTKEENVWERNTSTNSSSGSAVNIY